MLTESNKILNFWADAGPERWWSKDPSFDALILSHFGRLHQRAAMGGCDDWEFQGPNAALALIIVLDQFSRNLYRDSPAAYACDAKALAIVHRLMKNGDDRRMRDDIGQFLYMPLMHSENLSDQDISVRETARIEGPDDLKSAHRHRDIIARFGRFPHRNAVLGRVSTPAEIAFLKNGGFSG
ncbi:DUF924 family protein [Acaryochloris sp. IP29b_bin.148]|uniref:DUF924 family protein n=1 Tax=Acaryochloris sp. IP29b_bin.148 TaxID=2969218 RepID=UPI002638E53C|nr:DUF924 family protein [Acaryochloris sp. IP29b_bin.148]